LAGVLLFILWGVSAARLLFKRGNKGLLGFAMLFPWILFFTELATVRIQEPFVLYRSYLWAVGGFFAIPVLLNSIEKKMVVFIAAAVLATFFMLSMERLVTMSQPILLWADAQKLLDGRFDVRGADRIYYNLGVNYLKSDMLTEAEDNLKKAIAANPDSAQSHAALGGSYNMRHQWHEAVSEYSLAESIERRLAVPPNWRYFAGRARAHDGAGELREAVQDYVAACRLNISVCDNLRKSAIQK
jgi:tetratricopeptide (TPR) repeat protein